MPVFLPSPGPSVWITATGESRTFEIPVRPKPVGQWRGATVRIAISANSADVFINLGGPDITTSKEAGIYLPAGTVETITISGYTHIAAMTTGPAVEINLTIGTGD